jgi:hypothetical protein
MRGGPRLHRGAAALALRFSSQKPGEPHPYACDAYLAGCTPTTP